MRGYVVLSLELLAGNSCKVLENVLCPAVIMSSGMEKNAFVGTPTPGHSSFTDHHA